MQFASPLVRGRLVQRYKRFFADVELDAGGLVTAHVPNPGAMLGLKEPGQAVWLSKSDDLKRKLAHTLEMVEAGPGLVGVNTMHPNRLGAEAIAAGLIPELAGYARLRREVKYAGDSRIDILLEDDARAPCYVEIKNSHFLREPGVSEFPDCVTVRGVKHLKALERMVEAGHRAVMLFVVQRTDCDLFDTADDIDRAYGPALRDAAARGVEVLCYGCHLSPEAIRLERPLRWRSRP
ncbi:DNA/RNA nuclease SfsA [Caulobacter sp. 17J80-11]|uniref:DNA/RNA nuclease SfsA n=1 Tax=Caulobacter sp. 17J80-11 TaxID=2763502 RepID=UPI00165360AC|nr:DNA/RNA nuclease SfsA [Caulobacter sp. 17J80-11]MBC6981138.1 DNA/RNA nuclease SfsA [Caulobacter sp. 17J80-11]